MFIIIDYSTFNMKWWPGFFFYIYFFVGKKPDEIFRT